MKKSRNYASCILKAMPYKSLKQIFHVLELSRSQRFAKQLKNYPEEPHRDQRDLVKACCD